MIDRTELEQTSHNLLLTSFTMPCSQPGGPRRGQIVSVSEPEQGPPKESFLQHQVQLLCVINALTLIMRNIP